MNFDTAGIGTAVAAIGALGTASFGLVDTLKTLPRGGLSNRGFGFIEIAIKPFFEGQIRKTATGNVKRLFDTLHGNWVNGIALADQKAIAKSLIKLRLNKATAGAFAAATEVDPAVLQTVGEKMSNGAALEPNEVNVLGRFDLALTAILDDGYQHADQRYRNFMKFMAMVISTVLAVVGVCVISETLDWQLIWQAFLAGLLAGPFAPITKDLASALAAGVKVAQALRK
jgi:branched-subunit amino acid transport protein